MIGKVKRFNARRNHGVLASIGGASLDFTHTDPGGVTTPLTEGQVVTYRAIENASPPAANDVRPAQR
jgi:cold shock CspA family protein